MGLGTIDEAIEDFKKMTTVEREIYQKNCLNVVQLTFNAAKASFIPEVQALVDVCVLQTVDWWECDFAGKKLLRKDDAGALVSRMEEEEINPSFPSVYHLGDIKYLFENLVRDTVWCSLPGIFNEIGISFTDL